MKLIFFLSLLILFPECKNTENNDPAGADGWLTGNADQKFETIAAQLRGFDLAMVETAYRYQELYWAGRDENWDYASYQLEKIKLAIKNGLERRPKRAASAVPFLENTIPEMQAAVNSKDTVTFFKSYQLLTASCNACHVKEKVSFFTVQPPTVRTSSIRK